MFAFMTPLIRENRKKVTWNQFEKAEDDLTGYDLELKDCLIFSQERVARIFPR